MKKEIKEFTAEQLNLLANIMKLTREHSYDSLEEVINYIDSNVFDFSNKK